MEMVLSISGAQCFALIEHTSLFTSLESDLEIFYGCAFSL
jgi:hypothetical protein